MTTSAKAWVGIASLSALVVGLTAHRLLTSRMEDAPRAELVALLPAAMRIPTAPGQVVDERASSLLRLAKGLDLSDWKKAKAEDPGAMARFAAKNASSLFRLESNLSRNLRWPSRSSGLEAQRGLFKLAWLVRSAALVAARRGDTDRAVALALLGSRYSDALRGFVPSCFWPIVVRSNAASCRTLAELAQAKALSPAALARLLAALPEEDGRDPGLARSLRREGGLAAVSAYDDIRSNMDCMPNFDAGTFDAKATARLISQMYLLEAADIERPASARTHEAAALRLSHKRGLPDYPTTRGPLESLAYLGYKVRMNAGTNTMGRLWATMACPAASTRYVLLVPATRNVVRAALLMRQGGKADIPDLCDTGALRIDRKRRLVWSIGLDGKDDNGTPPRHPDGSDGDIVARY